MHSSLEIHQFRWEVASYVDLQPYELASRRAKHFIPDSKSYSAISMLTRTQNLQNTFPLPTLAILLQSLSEGSAYILNAKRHRIAPSLDHYRPFPTQKTDPINRHFRLSQFYSNPLVLFILQRFHLRPQLVRISERSKSKCHGNIAFLYLTFSKSILDQIT